MSRSDIKNLLTRYLDGQTTASENRLLENWLDSNNLNDNWERLDKGARAKWLNSLLIQIENDTTSSARFNKWLNEVSTVQWASIAAMVLICFAVIVKLTIFESKSFQQPLTSAEIPIEANYKVILKDGSNVWVNSGATLRYCSNFNTKTREVYLTGEAYFDIKHQPAKPFLVHTGKVDIAVLGTAFNIKSDVGSKKVIVTVKRGRVKVTEGKKFVVFLTPNQQIVCNTTNNHYSQTSVNASEAISWLEKDMTFNNITFGEAADLLQKRFKIKIQFKSAQIKNSLFSGTAPKGNDLDDILKVLCAFNHASYTKLTDGSIIISEAPNN